MALRRQGQRHDPVNGRSSFAHAALSAVPADILPILKNLQGFLQDRAALNNDGLVITLHKSHFLGGGHIAEALAKTPGLENYISFKDRDVIRPCSDVVFDLEKDALRLARILYKNPAPQRYIVITPPTVGQYADAPDVTECTPQHVTNRYGKDVIVHTDLGNVHQMWDAEKKKNGLRHTIQTDDIRLQIVHDDISALRFSIKVEPIMAHIYNGRKEPLPHVLALN